MSTDDTTNCPKFLYSSTVKKLHKRSHTRYQSRRLEFYNDRVDYFKIDSERRCGTIPLNGVRAELCKNAGNSNHFEFVFDDLKERRYVFKCSSDVARASMLWIANGEQFNNYRSTIKQLRPETLDFMMEMKSQNFIREMIRKKYQQAASHFMSAKDGSGYQRPERDYEDANSVGLMHSRVCTDSSSTDDDEDDSSNASSNPRSSNFKASSRQHPSLKSAQMPSLEFEMDGGYITHAKSQSELQQNFITLKGTPSLEHSDDPNYMSLPQLTELHHKMKSQNVQSEIALPPKAYNDAELACNRVAQSAPGIVYNITYDCANANIVDFGSREVHAIKVRIQGQVDYKEVDVNELGETLEEFTSCLCRELEIEREEIACIRKLPDVRITNDKDVSRIRAGRQIEVELTDT